MRLAPDNARVQWQTHQMRAELYFHNRDYDRAIADYTFLIGLDGKSATAYDYRGFVFATKGDHERAIADYTEAIRLEPDAARLYNHRSWSYLQAGKPAEALADAERAVQYEPSDASYYGVRALVYQALGRANESIADLRKGLALDPTNEGIRQELQKLEQQLTSVSQVGKQNTAAEMRETDLSAEVKNILERVQAAERVALNAMEVARRSPGDATAKTAAREAADTALRLAEAGERRLTELEVQGAGIEQVARSQPSGAAVPSQQPGPVRSTPSSTDASSPTRTSSSASPTQNLEPAATALSRSRAASPLSSAEELALKRGDTFEECDRCPDMVVVPPGEFMMGSNDGEGEERPVRKIAIARLFAVSRFEATLAEWDACVSEGGCKHKPEDKGWGRDRRPAINVSWNDVVKEYLPWINQKTGKQYRLLTEAEWEYVARAGSTTKYTWGEDVGRGRANCDGCSSQWDNKQTAPVGSFQPNAFGLYDVHGNVAEWVADCRTAYDAVAATREPAEGDTGCNRVTRGGAWYNRINKVRVAFRGKASPAERLDWVGFRLARSLDRQ